MKLLSKIIHRATYTPLNTVTINAAALVANYNYINTLSPLRVAPNLKSNAYGHGLVQIAGILDEVKPPFFCVDSLYEAYILQKAKIQTPILITGYVSPENLRYKNLPFSFTAYNVEMITTILTLQPHASIHLFVDTGMHREGVRTDELANLLSSLTPQKRKHIKGLMSHFAMADQPNNQDTLGQIKAFTKTQTIVKNAGINPDFIHISASTGILNLQKYYPKLGNVTRVGTALYGIDPSSLNTMIQPILSLTTTLVQIKKINNGEKIGYDFTYTAPKNMIIGILPIGYFDGVDKRLSSNGVVKIGNNYCKILGRISMNITIIDLSNIVNPHVGDTVIIYSTTKGDKNSIQESAKLCKTISYELLVHIASTTKRVVI